MVDKLNRINVNVGGVKNDLNKQSKSQEQEKVEAKQPEKSSIECKNVDPDKVMDAMKKHGLHNLNHVMASGKVASKSISDTMDYFTTRVSPQMHGELTNKVQAVFKQEFPNAKLDPDVIAEVVDNLIFSAL